jgi:multidrug resistance protein
MSKEKSIIIFTVAIDVIGLGIIIPVLPVYVESFGISAFSVALLFSAYSLFSFLSAPFLGALSDKIGRRPVLIGSIASTSLGWFIFALGHNLPVLLLGRIIDGLAAGNISTAQSSISDLSKDSKERAGNLGIIGMIFGLGFVVGPFLGGLLSKVSHAFPFFFVGALALLNVILAYFFLPETNKNIDQNKKINWNPLKPLISAIKNIHLRTLYIVWFMFNTIAVGANTIFALFLGKSYGLSPFTTGLFFTGIGLILALNQGYLLKNFWLKKFKEKQLIILMLIFFSIGFLFMSIHSIYLFIFGMIFSALGQSVLGVAMTSEIIGEASQTERGEAVGVLSAIGAAANIIAPIGSGLLFQQRHNFPYIAASILSIITLTIFYKTKVKDVQTTESEILAEEVTA